MFCSHPGFGVAKTRADSSLARTAHKGSSPTGGALFRAAKSLLRDLIAFDTTSRNSNLPMIEYVADYLSDHGASIRLVPAADGTKANLFANAGVPAIVCGPGDIAQAHQPNEFIEITQLDSRLGFLERIALPS